MKKKVISILLALTLVFTMMPLLGAYEAQAETGDPAICLALGGNAPNISGGQESSVYYGNYKQSGDGNGRYTVEPIKWRVLDNKKDVTGNYIGELFLLSDKGLDCQLYHSSYVSITWKESTIRAWLNDSFMKSAFSDEEKAEVATTLVRNKKTDDYTPNPYYPNRDGGEDTEDDVFLLSIAEAQNTNYGFTGNYNGTQTREAKNTDYAKARGALTNTSSSYAGNGYWWLRSPGSYAESAAFVEFDGSLDRAGVGGNVDTFAVRPALNLNLKSLIFTSAAVGGKSSEGIGADSLKSVGTNSSNEWKVTVKSGHDDFKIDKVSTCDGKKIYIEYSEAKTGDNEYISAIITDKDGNVKFYGNLKNCKAKSDASDTVAVNTDGKLETGDTFYVFNEQLNGDYKTDYASELKKITIPQNAGHDWEFQGFLWKGDKENGFTSAKANYECRHDDSHLKNVAATITEKTTDPSCTEAGKTTYTATVPKDVSLDGKEHAESKDAKAIIALGHVWGAWTKLDATQHQRVCEHDATHVEKENHKWDGGKVTKAPTTTSTGIKTYTCTICGAEKTETIPVLPKPEDEYGTDGTPAGPGASDKAAEKAITEMTSDNDIAGSVFALLKLKSTKQGKASIKLTWTKNNKAVRYVVYGNRCNAKGVKYKPVKIAATEATSFIVKEIEKTKMKKGTYYKFVVVALDGNGRVVSTSKMIHVATKGGKVGNHKSVTVRAKVGKKKKAISKVSLKNGKSLKLSSKPKPASKKLKVKKHVGVRYETTNANIAAVSGNGVIKANGNGTCYIYAYAQNGVAKAIKVTVK